MFVYIRSAVFVIVVTQKLVLKVFLCFFSSGITKNNCGTIGYDGLINDYRREMKRVRRSIIFLFQISTSWGPKNLLYWIFDGMLFLLAKKVFFRKTFFRGKRKLLFALRNTFAQNIALSAIKFTNVISRKNIAEFCFVQFYLSKS